MNIKYIFLLCAITVVVSISLPSLAEVIASSAVSDKPDLSEAQNQAQQTQTPPVFPCPGIKIRSVKGGSYFIDRKIVELQHPGVASCGYYRTDHKGVVELIVAKDIGVMLYPETEVQIEPLGPKWPKVMNVYIHKGEVDFVTNSKNSENLRVITDGICVNPEKGNFKVIYRPEICSGEIVVKEGILRATSDADPNRFCSISTSFGIRFTDGRLNIPVKASLRKYQWNLNL
jgi:hypothetical protein